MSLAYTCLWGLFGVSLHTVLALFKNIFYVLGSSSYFRCRLGVREPSWRDHMSSTQFWITHIV